MIPTRMPATEYQRLAGVTAKYSAPWREKLMHWTIGLTNEAGELAGVVKKLVCRRTENTHTAVDYDLRAKILDEGGDVLWYLSQVGELVGVSIQDMMEHNIRKLKARHPEKFAAEIDDGA